MHAWLEIIIKIKNNDHRLSDMQGSVQVCQKGEGRKYRPNEQQQIYKTKQFFTSYLLDTSQTTHSR